MTAIKKKQIQNYLSLNIPQSHTKSYVARKHVTNIEFLFMSNDRFYLIIVNNVSIY